MEAYQLDTNGFIIANGPFESMADLSVALNDTEANLSAAGWIVADPPVNLVKPQYVNGAWVEGATQADFDADLQAYKDKLKEKVDFESQAKFFELLGGNLYIVIAHFVKGFEVNGYWNKNLKPTGDVDDQPQGHRKRSSDNTEEYPILEQEAARRGITVADLVNLAKPLTGIQWNLISDIEAIRPTAKDDIDAAVDKAAADAVYAQFETDLAAITTRQ